MTKTDKELISIADTIKKQIPTVVLMSCGANKYGYLKESEEKRSSCWKTNQEHRRRQEV